LYLHFIIVNLVYLHNKLCFVFKKKAADLYGSCAVEYSRKQSALERGDSFGMGNG
jgi:hypothetical protein